MLRVNFDQSNLHILESVERFCWKILSFKYDWKNYSSYLKKQPENQNSWHPIYLQQIFLLTSVKLQYIIMNYSVACHNIQDWTGIYLATQLQIYYPDSQSRQKALSLECYVVIWWIDWPIYSFPEHYCAAKRTNRLAVQPRTHSAFLSWNVLIFFRDWAQKQASLSDQLYNSYCTDRTVKRRRSTQENRKKDVSDPGNGTWMGGI